MKQIYLVLILTTQFLVTSCGGIQRARVYIYADTNPNATTKSWGDGLATADNDVCIWVNSSHGGYDVMWAGPIFLPVMPIGAAAETLGGKLEPGDNVLIRISVFPADTTAQPIEWTFDPANIFVEFENGDVIQPASFAVHRYSTTSDDSKGVRNEERQTRPIGKRKPLIAHPNPEKYSGWTEFELLVPKPDKSSHPTALEIRSLNFANGHEKNYKFTINYVEERRYVYSGHSSNGELWNETPADPCIEIYNNADVVDKGNHGS